jgi:pimeloyl-ACP methyl ester carboxylesterase
MKSETLTFENARGEKIVGILEINPDALTKVAIINHGMLCHKDWHYQKALAVSLPFSTFRPDFRGAGDSDPVADDALPMHLYADYDADVEDLQVCIYHIFLGHDHLSSAFTD